MLMRETDIIRYEGASEIIEIGGKVNAAETQIAMHKETGVVFMKQCYKSTKELYCFTVGKLDANGEITDKKEYHEKTEKDFFDAVRYFEELIHIEQPEDNESPPSVGLFYFSKSKDKKLTKLVAYAEVQGMKVIIEETDISKVFTPPQSKPYGRLDMTVVDKKEYEVISSKFALKYNKEKSEEFSKVTNIDLSDCAVYDMTPYSNNTEESQGESAPDDVNDNALSPDQIEGEDVDDDKNKDKQKKERQEQKEKEKQDAKKEEPKDEGEKSDDKSESEESDGEPQEQDGESQEKDGKKSDKESKSKPSDKTSKPEEGEDSNKNADTKKPHKKEKETPVTQDEDAEDSEEKSEDVKQSDEKDGEKTDEKSEQEIDKDNNNETVQSKDIIEALSDLYSTKDLKGQWRKQKNLLSALDAFTELELKSGIYQRLNLPEKLTKQEFISLVESKTKNLFQ